MNEHEKVYTAMLGNHCDVCLTGHGLAFVYDISKSQPFWQWDGWLMRCLEHTQPRQHRTPLSVMDDKLIGHRWRELSDAIRNRRHSERES